MGTPKKPGAGEGKKNSQWVGGSKSNDARHARAAWAKCNGRSCPAGYIVHHKDGDPTNNACSNLQLTSLAEHNETTKEGKSWEVWAVQAKNKKNSVPQRRYR